LIVIYGVKAYDGIIGIIARKFISSLLSFYILQKGGDCMAKAEDMQKQAVLNYKQNGGNMEKAMLDAGYAPSTARYQQSRLLKKVGTQIKEAQKEIRSPKIKTIQEIQEWWSAKMNDPNVADKDKIKCSELLVKSMGGFVDNVNVNAKMENPLSGLTTEELKKLSDDG
jgi:hypothetical protein